MLLMLAEVLQLCSVSTAVPDSSFWRFLCEHQSHVPWVGCSLHDLIQPGFSFLVGVALPFSIANRQARGQGFRTMASHAAVRVLALVILGVLLQSVGPRRIIWEFVDTLTQIGLAYYFVFLLAFRSTRICWIALWVLLFGYWLAFAIFPLPGTQFDYATVGVSSEWLQHHGLKGFAAHWQKNSHLAWAFDSWFLNLFPREEPYSGSQNGLTTLNFVPLIGTMILGLLAGRLLRSDGSAWSKVCRLGIAGVAGIAVGWGLGVIGVCPVVKAIWTPSWVLFSGGWCSLLLGAFCAIVDIGKQKSLVFPLVVVGMNSIAAYSISKLYPAVAFNSLRRIAHDLTTASLPL